MVQRGAGGSGMNVAFAYDSIAKNVLYGLEGYYATFGSNTLTKCWLRRRLYGRRRGNPLRTISITQRSIKEEIESYNEESYTFTSHILRYSQASNPL